MATKKALKAVRAKLGADEPEGALYDLDHIVKSLGDKDPDAPVAWAYRALALTHLERNDEAEKSYLRALAISPGHVLATQGIRKLYTKTKRWDELGRILEFGVQVSYDEGDADKLTAALQELVNHRLKHGPEDKLYTTLRLLVPSSPLVPLIQSAPVPAGSYVPLQSPTYPAPANAPAPSLPRPLPHVRHLAGSLALVLYLLLRTQAEVYTTTEKKVKAGRQRIGAGTERDVRRKVDGEVLRGALGSNMVNLLRDVASHSSVDEGVRRDVEVQEFKYWRKLVASSSKAVPKGTVSKKAPKEETHDEGTPALFQQPEVVSYTKAEALKRADDLANGFILLNVGGSAEEAWIWVLEGRDEPTINYDLDLLHKFAHTFPTSSLTDFIDDYCRWFKLPLPEPETAAEEVTSPTSETTSEKKVKYNRPRRGRGKAGMNARERRAARRQAKAAGQLPDEIGEEEREELSASMAKLLERLSRSVFAYRVMARVAIQDEDWANAVAYAEKGRKLVSAVEAERGVALPKAHTSLDEALGVALVPYYPPKHHTRAARLLDGVLKASPDDYEVRFAKAQILETAGDWTAAQAEFQILIDQHGTDKEITAAREELGWCLVNEGKLEEGRDVLEEVVQTLTDADAKDDEPAARARAWWRLGRTEWMIGDEESRTNAEEWFMSSMRADATYAPAYTSLGICYAEAHSPPDTERSLKCFQKAFELDATEVDAARRLAYGYAADDEWAQVRAIAVRVMEGEGGVEGVAGGQAMNATGRFAPKNGWAWKALGSTEMHYKNYPKASEALQIALRAEPEDAGLWRLLGDAYVKSGRHMAGLKALQHALELDPAGWMAQYHIGEVYLQLGAFDKAIEEFMAVEKATEGQQVGITAALAEATLALGRQAAAGGFRERSRRAFHEAIEYATRVLVASRVHRAWGWKLIGDAALQLADHETELADVQATADVLLSALEHLAADDDDRRSNVAGLGHVSNLLQAAPGAGYTAKAAIFAFAYRAHLLKNEIRVADASLYDLGCALHSFAVATADETERTAATKAALAAIRLALERDASDERLWNAFGVICAKAGPQLAQHAFVVSLECYAKDPVVWTNLGFLYLQLDDRDLANECFLKSQIMDPDYARAWFGQAVLAQGDGQHDVANNLFAHAFTLSQGSLLEADLALALGAFNRYFGPGWDATPLQQPAFALQHYTHSRPRDAAARHLYALVCERLGLADKAADELAVAVQLLEEEFEATEAPEVEANYTIALVNLGRVRLAAQRYPASLEAFNNATELAAGSDDARVVALLSQAKLGAALAHFWLEDLDASLELFQAALDAAKNDAALTDELTVLLARTLWGVGGEDAREAAKTHLMACLENPEPSVKVIAALGAAGLSSADTDLVDAAVAELANAPPERRRAQDPAGAADIVLFANAIAAGDAEAALAVLESAAVSSPHAAAPRNRLAKAYLAAGKSAEAAALLAGAKEYTAEDAGEADRLRGEAATLEGQDGFASLQRAVMLEPWNETAWEALAWAKRAVAEADGEVGPEAAVEVAAAD